MNLRVIPLCTAVLLSAAVAEGQACIGLASLASRPMNLTVGASFADGTSGGDARFGFGTTKAFGGVSASFAKADGVSGTAKGIGLDGGLSYPVGEKKKGMMLCPVASGQYSKFPDIGPVSLSGITGTAGLAIGGVIETESKVNFIPFASARAAYDRVSVSGNGESDSSSDTYGILSGGVSVAFERGVLIRPFVQIPVGVDGADAVYGVGVSFAFGKR